MRRPRPAYISAMAAGVLAPKTELAKPNMRSTAITAIAINIERPRLCRLVRGGAKDGKSEHRKGQRIERGHQPIVKFGADAALIGLT